jgi:hypothetical protein
VRQTDDGYRDYCFIIKKKYEYNSPRSTTSVVIKSEVLRDLCAEVIGTIPPVSFRTSEVDARIFSIHLIWLYADFSNV